MMPARRGQVVGRAGFEASTRRVKCGTCWAVVALGGLCWRTDVQREGGLVGWVGCAAATQEPLNSSNSANDVDAGPAIRSIREYEPPQESRKAGKTAKMTILSL
jgi:hypothetical protein